MADCANFEGEKSAMEVLLEDLKSKVANNWSVKLIVTPKYHCELAGEDIIEYACGAMNHYFIKLSLDEKQKKESEKSFRDAVKCVKMFHMKISVQHCIVKQWNDVHHHISDEI